MLSSASAPTDHRLMQNMTLIMISAGRRLSAMTNSALGRRPLPIDSQLNVCNHLHLTSRLNFLLVPLIFPALVNSDLL